MYLWQISTKRKEAINISTLYHRHTFQPCLNNPKALKEIQKINSYVNLHVNHLHHHGLSSMFMNSFTKQDEGLNHSQFSECQHSSFITSLKNMIITNLSMYEIHFTYNTYKEVCSKLSNSNKSRCEGQRRRINNVVQESQIFPDPIRWIKLLIWTN